MHGLVLAHLLRPVAVVVHPVLEDLRRVGHPKEGMRQTVPGTNCGPLSLRSNRITQGPFGVVLTYGTSDPVRDDTRTRRHPGPTCLSGSPGTTPKVLLT